MEFLFSLNVLLGAHLVALAALFKPDLAPAVRLRMTVPHLLVGMVCVAAVLSAVLANDGSTNFTGRNTHVIAFLLFGVASAVLFGWRTYQLLSTPAMRSVVALAIFSAAVPAGAYVAFAAADHMTFFNDKDKAGIANASAMEVSDITCDSMVLVRIEEQDAVYRCPTSLVWGGLSVEPFAPWPTYREGRSADLKHKIDATFANARRIEPSKP